MQRTVYFLAVLSASVLTVRADIVTISTSSLDAKTLRDGSTPDRPDQVLLDGGGMLQAYSDGRIPLEISFDVLFGSDAPAGSVLESATLYLHVAMAQWVFGSPYLYAFAYLDDDGSVQLDDFARPSTYVGSTDPLGNLGDTSDLKDVLVAIDVTAFMQSAVDHPAPYVGFLFGAGDGSVSVWGLDDQATAPLLVRTFAIAVPEPSAIAMMGAGAIGLGLVLTSTNQKRTAKRR